MNKEELIIENARLQNEEADLRIKDKERRVEFAKAFKWVKEKSYASGLDPEPVTPSWAEIFVQVGKLLVRDGMKTMQDELNRIKDVQGGILRTLEESKDNFKNTSA